MLCGRSDHLSPEGHILGRTGQIVRGLVMHPIAVHSFAKASQVVWDSGSLEGFYLLATN